jgi:hypothetical protein
MLIFPASVEDEFSWVGMLEKPIWLRSMECIVKGERAGDGAVSSQFRHDDMHGCNARKRCKEAEREVYGKRTALPTGKSAV